MNKTDSFCPPGALLSLKKSMCELSGNSPNHISDLVKICKYSVSSLEYSFIAFKI